ncbi:thiamine ABC transporter substrate-binding protein [Tepiditoga spiralis]|uniref:Thiamine ABC transporter substrate-binding protein n=1 Tax=Tepiditoga spiralis TaxID=2108365 RepID=A0A7G1GCA7_9BACT|nr:thiamine ABC transporter substrate-binding protein [Tepiditoga spiralis]BBE32049.1 thiamine ABC transporter substrate-binding protein [Tepiditoga spiralis]
MKKGILVIMSILIVISVFSTTLTVYTYESLNWVEDKVLKEFESMYGCDVNLVKLGDGGSVLSRLLLEKKNSKADVVVGLDQSLSVKAIKEGILEKYTPINISKINNKDLILNDYTVPYDYGGIAFVYNPKTLKTVPTSFEDLTKLNKKIIIQDPRTSSTGQSFLLWTIAVYGDNWQDFWKRLKPAILTVAPGWDESFSKFEAGEAPIMVSYATDGAYSYQYYKSTKYKAFIPKEGAYVQIETASIIKNTKNEELAKRFIEFLLMNNFQKEIPLNQWMFPVTNTTLPESFKYAIIPEKIVSVDSEKISKNMETWLEQWEKIMY